MGTAPRKQPTFTPEQLVEMSRRQYRGDCTAMVHAMARQLLATGHFNNTITEQWIRDRARIIELQRFDRPSGRVLMVDLPPFDEERDHGAVQVYSDMGIELFHVSAPVGVHDPAYDEALVWALSDAPWHFQGMPWRLGTGYSTTWTRCSDAYRERREREWKVVEEIVKEPATTDQPW